MPEFLKVATRGEIPAGSGKTVDVRDHSIALFNCDGTFYAIDDTCAHQGGPLGEGELAGTIVTCPWHEWCYDVRTGINVDDPTCKVSAYAVRVEGEDVLVCL